MADWRNAIDPDQADDIKDGGPAFPHMMAAGHRDYAAGLTMRDYFAVQALASGAARSELPEYDLRSLFGPTRTGIKREDILAADAYRIADALLERRNKPYPLGNP